ncbi:MAG: class I SAM-dependent methyltransferase, partial [Proteobacteria bacterium]|nr:class I SAM-dependent methyltransferase [Pseudomonadota bacterium]
MLTDFGFKDISFKEKTKKVQKLFEDVASSYDLMNDLMSLGIHRFWKKYLVQSLNVKTNQCILDLAGGTADLALTIQKTYPYLRLKTIVCDLTPAMLVEGRNKAINKGLTTMTFVCANAEALPFPDHTFD